MTGTDSMIEFINRCMDLEERAAQLVAEHGLDTLLPGAVIDHTGATVFFTPEGYDLIRAALDPANTIARITTDRQILALHTGDFPYDPDDGPGDYSWTEQCNECGEVMPCPTVRLKAQQYAGWKGWQDEWRYEP